LAEEISKSKLPPKGTFRLSSGDASTNGGAQTRAKREGNNRSGVRKKEAKIQGRRRPAGSHTLLAKERGGWV